MEKSEHQAADQVWGWTIEHEAPKRKKDRAQAVLYTVAGFHPSSPWGRPSLWTKAEAYALKHDLWIAERTEDQPDALARSAHQRPGLLRTVRLVVCAGGLLLEDLNDLDDSLTKAAVVSLFRRCERPVVAAGRLIGEERARTLVRQVGGPDQVETPSLKKPSTAGPGPLTSRCSSASERASPATTTPPCATPSACAWRARGSGRSSAG